MVYLSIDIDVLDPAFAPATGTPEVNITLRDILCINFFFNLILFINYQTGGWSTRELRRIIRGLEGIKLVGADIVEVATPYDTNAQVTAIAAADIMFEGNS